MKSLPQTTLPGAGVAEAAHSDFLLFNLGAPTTECGSRCPGLVASWAAGHRRRSEDHPDLRVIDLAELLPGAPVGEVMSEPMAILLLPRTLDAYYKLIGDKSRNVIRKAEKSGYVYRVDDYADFLDDIREIRTSDLNRQGKPIPEYFKADPTAPIETKGYCSVHFERFYGAYLDGRLRAYLTIRVIGELAQVWHILGHADYLTSGVMYGLTAFAVADLIEFAPQVLGINYLYMRNPAQGLDQFKSGLGFRPVRTGSFAGERSEIGQRLSLPDPRSAPRDVEQGSKKMRPALALRPKDYLFDGSPLSPAWLHGLSALQVILQCNFQDRPETVLAGQFVHLGFDRLSQETIQREALNRRMVAFDALGEIPAESADLVINATPLSEVTASLSKGLARFGQVLRPHGLLATGLPTDVEALRANPALRDCLIDFDAAAFSKRFGASKLTVEGLDRVFRGGAFQVRGIVDVEHAASEPSGLGWLVLEKVAVKT